MIAMTLRMLAFIALLCTGAVADEQPAIRVAIYDDAGTSESVQRVERTLANRASVRVQRIKAADIRDGRLGEFDVLIHPGGSGGGQARSLGPDGRDHVREFVSQGGGFIGICAGAYLASNNYEWSLGLLDAKVVDSEHWARGYGDVQITTSGGGQSVLGLSSSPCSIYYHQGPLLAPGSDPDLPDYRCWATFASEIAKNGAPKGVMPGTTAIAAGEYGKGRVLCFSPHPEKTAGMRDVVYRGVLWSAGHGIEAAVEAPKPGRPLASASR